MADDNVRSMNGGGQPNPAEPRHHNRPEAAEDTLRAVSQAALRGNPIDQVRELLFGDAQRTNDNRIATLDGAMRAMELRLIERLDGIDRRIDELSQRTKADQASALRSVGAAIEEVGRQITALGAGQASDDAARD